MAIIVKNSVTSIYLHTYTYFAHPIDFFAFPILQTLRIVMYGFSLPDATPSEVIRRHFGAINK